MKSRRKTVGSVSLLFLNVACVCFFIAVVTFLGLVTVLLLQAEDVNLKLRSIRGITLRISNIHYIFV